MNIRNIFIFSICILSFGCSKTREKSFIISGTVNDPEILTAELKTADSVYIDTIENGKFLFVVHGSGEKYVDLEAGCKVSLYAEPGDSINVSCTNNNCSFSGKGFEESKFLYEKGQLIKELGFDDPRKIDIALFSNGQKIFQTKIDSIKQIRIRQIEEFKKQYPQTSDSFYNTEKQLVDYFEINQLFLFPAFHEMLTESKPELSDNYYEFTKHIKLNKKELYFFNEYKSAINFLLDFKTESLNEKYYLAKKVLTGRDFFDELLYDEINRYINFNGIEDIDNICVDFTERLGDAERKSSLQDKYDDWKKLAKGEKAPDFEIKDDKGSLVHLSDFKGKYVYIDCWSSYCGPCLAEMPEMKKLAEELKNKNIVFVSVSADQDTERWLGKVKEFDMNTVNLCTEGTKHQFNIDYNAKAFPRYILIDDKGLIIDATADKPSEIKEKIEQLL